MNVVGAEEHGLSWLEPDEVEEERDEKANVLRELAVETRQEFRETLTARRGSCFSTGETVTLLLDLREQLVAGGLDVLFLRVHEVAESLFQRLLELLVRPAAALNGRLETSSDVLAHQASEGLDVLQEIVYLIQRPEAAQPLEGRDRNRHLGLVVVVLVLFGVLGVQLLRELFVRVRLDRERFLNGQHLEQEGQLLAVASGHVGPEQHLVVLHHVDQAALRLDFVGWVAGVRAHP